MKLGFHTGYNELQNKKITSMANVFQVFPGNPRSFHSANIIKYKEAFDAGLYIIFHAPYVFRVTSSTQNVIDHLLKYVEDFANQVVKYYKNHTIFLVIHSGENKLMNEHFDIWNRLYNCISPSNMKILIENCSHNSEDDVQSIINLNGLDNKMFGLCFDTEHAYAGGIDVSEFVNSHCKDIDIYHINAVPQEVTFGGHLDRHSKTKLSDCKNIESHKSVITKAKINNSPMILERDELETIECDLNYIFNLMYGV